ncbi:efflux RND transporter periplasmic adaptor subunit [Brevibacillus agri]|uniref:efflux RND transporter periplasmic adaptor subunit n=1 Tax=Brevibacillus agri TaxID=51101 RepID=UPI003D1C3368
MILLILLGGGGGWYYLSQAVEVRVVPVIQDDLVQTIQASGKVRPKEEHTLFAQASGRLLRLYVESGDMVKENQVIAELDTTDAESQLQQLQMQAVQIQADWEKMKEGPKPEEVKRLEELVRQQEINVDAKTKEWQRLQTEYEIGAIPKVVWEEKEDELRLAQSQLEAARHELELAYQGPTAADADKYRAKLEEIRLQQDQLREDLMHMQIISRKSGTVIDLPVKEGQWVTKGTELLTIADLSELKVVSQVKENLMGNIHMGQEAIVEGSSLGKEQLPARVIEIAPVAKPSASNPEKKAVVEVTLGLQEGNPKLLSGLNVDVHFVVNHAKQVLQVPIAAIKKKTDGTNYLWIVQENKATQVPVEVGIRNDKYIEVTKGVQVNDLVIVNSPDMLKEGQNVKVVSD